MHRLRIVCTQARGQRQRMQRHTPTSHAWPLQLQLLFSSIPPLIF
jgi:hypothetical protein